MIDEKKINSFASLKRILSLLLAFLMLILPALAAEEETEELELEQEEETDESVQDELPSEPETESEPELLLAPAPLSYSAPDQNFIIVQKTFAGLPEELIGADFRIRVSADTLEEYTLRRDNAATRTKDAEGNIVWRWRLAGVGTGSYTVTEAGEQVENYELMSSGGGTVEVGAADVLVSVPLHETTCSHTDWPVRENAEGSVLFAATLTQGGVVVISRYPLSASERAAVTKAVLQINGPWKAPVYFYSIEEQLRSGNAFELNGATITYDAESEKVIIGRTRNWQHVATLHYSLSDADAAEIALRNEYRRAVAAVTVQKRVAGELGDREKRFAFTVSVSRYGEGAAFVLNGEARFGEAAFTLRHGESVSLTDIPLGATLTVSETDDAAARYTVSTELDHAAPHDGNTAAIAGVTEGEHLIVFTNRKDAVPDTGIAGDTLPYMLALGIVLAASALSLLRRRFGNREG